MVNFYLKKTGGQFVFNMICEGMIYQHFNLSTIRNFLGGSPTSRGYNQYQHDRSEKQGGRRQTLILGFPPTFLHPIFNRTTYEFLRGVANHVCCILKFYNCGFIPNLELLFTDAHPTVEGEGGNRVFGTFLSSLWQQIIFKGDCLTIWLTHRMSVYFKEKSQLTTTRVPLPPFTSHLRCED